MAGRAEGAPGYVEALLLMAMGATPEELHRTGTDPETYGAELADLFAYAVAAHPSRVKPQVDRGSARRVRLPFGRRPTG